MLVDLGRNDVGRVARYRSVEVTDIMTIERYSHVMHITSNVTGQLAEGRDAFDALRACLLLLRVLRLRRSLLNSSGTAGYSRALLRVLRCRRRVAPGNRRLAAPSGGETGVRRA